MLKFYFTFFTVAIASFVGAQEFERQYPDIALNTVASINIHPSGIGFAPQECGAVLKTLDGGQTWSQLFPDIHDESYEGFVDFVDDLDPNKVVYHNPYTLVKSDDGMATVQSIKMNPISGLINDFMVLENGDYAVLAGSFYYSSDEGQSWTETQTPEVDGLTMIELDGAIYVAYQAIMRSIDGGVTFDTVFYDDVIKRKFVNLDGKLILATLNDLLKSEDGGTTWEPIPAVDYYGYGDHLIAHKGRLITNSSNRINYSDDGGLTWVSVVMPVGVYRTGGIFLDETDQIFIGGEASQMYLTSDPQAPLQVIFGENEELYHVTSKGPAIVAVGGNGVLMRSVDNGNSWTKSSLMSFNMDLPGFIGNKLFVSKDNQELLLVREDNTFESVLSVSGYMLSFVSAPDGVTAFIATNESVFRTDDAGDSWASIYTPSNEIVMLHMLDNGNVAMLDNTGALYASTNNGETWDLATDSPDAGSNYLDFAMTSEMNFMVLSSSFLYTTKDGGATWSSAYRPYNGLRLYTLSENAVLCLGVNGADGWVYRSDDQGVTFPQIAHTCSTISRGGFYDAETHTFWTVGSGLGIQKMQLTVSGLIGSGAEILPFQVSPNPAVDRIWFPFVLSEQARVTVFDVMGSRLKGADQNLQSMDVSSFLPGQYQLLIEDGDQRMLSRFVKF